MPLVTPNNEINIPFTGDADNLVAESKRVIKEIEQIKQHTKTMATEQVRHAKAMEDAAKKQTTSWTEFRSMYSTVLDVVRVGQAVWDETAGKLVNYADDVRDVSRSLGTSTEEASRLIQVADDLGVSYDSLKTSMKLAQKDGFEPNIEGLAKLSDEYLKLEPGVARTQFLLDRFGKSGDEMGKILEKGGDSIRNMSAAIDESMILTQEAVDQAREFQIAQDALNDTWDAFTYEVGPAFLKTVTHVINQERDLLRAREIATEEGKKWYMLTLQQQDALQEQAAAERESADAALLAAEASTAAGEAFESEADATKRLAEEAKAAEQAIRDMTKANQEELDTLANMTGVLDAYNEKQSTLQEQHAELLAKKDELIKQGYHEEGKAIQDVNRDIDENIQKQQEAAEEFELATNRRILARAEELLSIDGLTTAEKESLIERGIAMGIYTEDAALKMRNEEQAAKDLATAINEIPDGKTISVVLDTLVNLGTTTGSIGGDTAGGAYGYSAGTKGWETVPPGYPNDTFPAMLTSGEKYAVIPSGETMNGSSGGSTSAASASSGDSAAMAAVMALLRRLPDDISRSNRALFERVGRR